MSDSDNTGVNKEEYVSAKKNVIKDISTIKEKLIDSYSEKEKEAVVRDMAAALYFIMSMDKLDEYSMLLSFVEDKDI